MVSQIGDIGVALKAGEDYVFVVERQPQQLAVWLETQPEKRMPVAVNEASDRLTVAAVPARTSSVEFFGRVVTVHFPIQVGVTCSKYVLPRQ